MTLEEVFEVVCARMAKRFDYPIRLSYSRGGAPGTTEGIPRAFNEWGFD